MSVKKKFRHKKSWILMVSILALCIGTAIGTAAFLTAKTDTVKNEFKLAEVPNEVVETFENNVKSDVKIQNTSENASAYIRAAVIASWVKVDEQGNATGEVYGSIPKECKCSGICTGECDYKMDWVKAGWTEGADGYFYYLEPVSAGESTGILFTACQPINADSETGSTPGQPTGYTLSIEILSQSIQSDGQDENGAKPVVLAWGTANGGSVTGVGGTSGIELQIETSEMSAPSTDTE